MKNFKLLIPKAVKQIKGVLLLVLFSIVSINSFSQAILTHTSNADFNQGNLNNMLVPGGSIVLPNQGTNLGSWASTTSLPKPLSGHRTTVWNQRVYLVGGYNATNGYSNEVYMASVNSAIGSWITLPSLPNGICDHAIVEANGFLYVIGGHQGGVPNNEIHYAKLNSDGTIDNWKLSSVSLPQGLRGHTAAYSSGHIYVVGGTNQSEDGTAVNTLYSFSTNPSGDVASISELPNALPEPRNQHSIAVYGKYLYVIGGYDNSFQKKNTVLYCQTNQVGNTTPWQYSTPLTQTVYGHSSTCFNGILTVMGGYYASDTLPGNENYYAVINDSHEFNWVSSYPYPHYRANGDAFAVNGKVFYLGGESLSNNFLDNCSFVNLSLSSEKVQDGIFVSTVFDLGDNRQLTELSYDGSDLGNYNILYRVAENNGDWGDWTNASQNNPVSLSLLKRYLQYMFVFETGDVNNNVSLQSVSLVFSASQVCGTIGGNLHWTKENSPYLVTCDLYLSSGTLTIDPGVEILFAYETGFEIGQANLLCNGAIGDSIKFTSFDGGSGNWDGVYFNSNSDNGVASALLYTIIEKAGFGNRDANLYCSSTSQPTNTACAFRGAEGHGVSLNSSNPTFNQCDIIGNTGSGLVCNSSSPTINYSYIQYNSDDGLNCTSSNPFLSHSAVMSNGNHGFSLNSSSPQILNCEIVNNSQYAIHCVYANSFPVLSGNVYSGNNFNAVVYGGGNMTQNGTWNNDGCDYVVLGDINIYSSSVAKLTMQAGITCKFGVGANLNIGYSNNGGELIAVGTEEQPIKFTSLNDSTGGWDGLYFTSYSDVNGATSYLEHCIIEKANQYNIYCVSTSQPSIIHNCNVRESAGSGIKLNNASISVDNCTIEGNLDSGVTLENNSNPIFTYSTIQTNEGSGLMCSSSSPQITHCEVLDNSQYAIYCIDANSFPIISGNNYTGNSLDAIVYGGGNMTSSGTWYNDGCDYIVEGDLVVYNSPPAQLYLEKGITCKFMEDAQLQMGYNNSYGGELVAIGSADSLITFTSLNDSVGGWDGLYFSSYSDVNGATSFLEHCIIEKGNQYNIYCTSTNQPATIQNCDIRFSAGDGVKLISATVAIDSCIINDNQGNGIYCHSSTNSTFTNSNIINNGSNGFWIQSSSPQIKNCEIFDNIGNAIDCSTMDCFPIIEENSYTGNFYNAVVYYGGYINANGTWYNDSCDYVVLGDVIIYNSTPPQLTLEPGITCKFKEGAQLQIGYNNYGGEINAIGSADSLITFTSLNDSTGGWDGLYFSDRSDYNGATSYLEHCIIEKGNQYNIYCSSTSQPATIQNCAIRHSTGDGIKLISATVAIDSCTINNNQGNGIYCQSSSNSTFTNSKVMSNSSNGFSIYSSSPQIKNCEILDNLGNAIDCSTMDCFPMIEDNDYTGNFYNAVVYYGGYINANGNWYNDSCDYVVLGDVIIYNSPPPQLTLEPGITCKFKEGVQLQIGYSNYGGEIKAIGSADSLITFTSLNDSTGGWDGLYFSDRSDYNGATSYLEHCIVENGNQYNIYCSSTSQPATIQNCAIRHSTGDGIKLISATVAIDSCIINDNQGNGIYCHSSSNSTFTNSSVTNNDSNGFSIYSSSPQIKNCEILDNIGNAIDCSTMDCFPMIEDNDYTGNFYNAVVYYGGYINTNGTWYNDSCDYIILGDVIIYNSPPAQLTLEPGITCKFMEGVQLQIGYNNYGGEIKAIGSADSLITFTSLNDSTGGWDGLYFSDRSDYNGATSYLEHCIVEKGNQYNIHCSSTNQPATIQNCNIRFSAGDGVKLSNASITLANTHIENNENSGIRIDGSVVPVIGNTDSTACDFYLNEGFDVYNNTATDVQAHYNNWNSLDSAFIASKIYDFYDDGSKGIVSFYPYSLVPPADTFSISGVLSYANNNASAINNAGLTLRTGSGYVMDFAQTNINGNYSFPIVFNGTYYFEVDPEILWGGVNSTDALMIMKHFAHIITLDSIWLDAADVNLSNSVNGTDALFVMKRFVNLIDSFPSDDWMIKPVIDPVFVNGQDASNNIVSLCAGDVNGSYLMPGGSDNPEIQIIHDVEMAVASKHKYTISVRIMNEAEVGAISLEFTYPEKWMNIAKVVLKPTQQELISFSHKGTTRVAWADLNAVAFEKNDLMLELIVETKDLSRCDGDLRIGISTGSELVDGEAISLENIVLSMPLMSASESPGYSHTHLATDNFIQGIHPNPFRNSTTIDYFMPEDAQVSISIQKIDDSRKVEILNQQMKAGKHQLVFNAQGFRQGIYLCTITISNNENTWIDSEKLILQR